MSLALGGGSAPISARDQWGSRGVWRAAVSTASRKSPARSPRMFRSSWMVSASGTALACASGATQNAAAAPVRSHTPWWTYCRVKRVAK